MLSHKHEQITNQCQKKRKGQSWMDNPDTGNILGTRHRTKTNKTKNTTQKQGQWITGAQ